MGLLEKHVEKIPIGTKKVKGGFEFTGDDKSKVMI
jgi:hypothetical protein